MRTCKYIHLFLNTATGTTPSPSFEHAQVQFLLIFLSDGAPSDHTKPALLKTETAWQCGVRVGLTDFVKQECYRRVEMLGDLFGRDRISIHTVAVSCARSANSANSS